jgi:flagellar biosynthetic protein FliR
MHSLAHLDLHLLVVFTLVLTRISGLVMTAPIYGTSDTPAQVRAVLAAALAMLITPSQLASQVTYPYALLDYLVVIGGELVIGAALGLGITILFSGTHLAGMLVSRSAGLALGESYDPSTAEELPDFSRLLFWISTAVFVTIGGHRMVMAGLLDTFAAIPPGQASHPPGISQALVVLVTQSLSLGLRAAAPAVAALLLGNLVMGLISRTLPQLNAMALGFCLNSLLTFGALALSLGAALWIFQEQLQSAMDTLLDGLSVAKGRWGQ